MEFPKGLVGNPAEWQVPNKSGLISATSINSCLIWSDHLLQPIHQGKLSKSLRST